MVRNKRPASARRQLIRFACIVSVVLFAVTGADAQRAGGGRGQPEAPAPTPGGPSTHRPPGHETFRACGGRQATARRFKSWRRRALYNEKGKSQYADNMAALKDGTLKDEARRVCVPDGLPRILGNPYPFQLIQTPGRVTFVYELNHVIRPIPLDKPQQSAEELEVGPYYSGHSVAHWNGDMLMIEAAGFNEKTFLDATGAPHSDAMTTVEQVKKVSDKALEDVITVTDPAMFTRT